MSIDGEKLIVSSLFHQKVVSIFSVKKIIVYNGLKVRWIDLMLSDDATLRIKNYIVNFDLLKGDVINAVSSNVDVITEDKFGRTT